MIRYKQGMKYQLETDYTHRTPFRPQEDLCIDYVTLFTDGRLCVCKGYTWDGPSGPTIDTKSFMRGSLVHDCLYELIYHELLDYKDKKYADKILVDICEQDGMNRLRRWWVLKGVQIGGDPRPSRIKPVLTAP